jgi:hypothetical protein
MMTIAGLCLLLLCVLLFLLGVEIGKRVSVPADGVVPAPVMMPSVAPSAAPGAPSDAPSAPVAAKP